MALIKNESKMDKVFKPIGASNHVAADRAEDDYYATDPIAIDKLLKVENPYSKIWECACGEGHLSKRLEERGYIVVSSDIVDRGYGQVCDFLKSEWAPNCDIITNPPYKYAKEFILHALDIAEAGSNIYMLLKLTFLEGKNRYKEIFSKYPPRNIYVFSERLKCAKNGDFEAIQKQTSAIAYAWFVWEKGYHGSTKVEWI